MYKEASEFIKAAEHCGIDPHEAAVYYYFIDELEKCGSINEFEKNAIIAGLLGRMATSMPKTFQAGVGALGKLNSPAFQNSMMMADPVGMGLSLGAGAFKGLGKIKASKVTNVVADAVDVFV